MTTLYEQKLETPTFSGKISFNTGLFIGGKFVAPSGGESIEVVNPSTGGVITKVAAASKDDVDIAVKAAQHAYKTSWGFKTPGPERAKLILKLADLVEKHQDEIAALESLNTGKPFSFSKVVDVPSALKHLRHNAGWADKVNGKTLEANENRFAYTRREPYGVVAQIVPWNFPLSLLCQKLAPALAAGNTVVLKPSEITPISALKLASLINEAGFPPGVINIINGYGHITGQALAEHPHIRKISFTGSTNIGRKIQEAAARSNLKVVTLELGGKNPILIFDDADLEQAVKWTARGGFFNAGQVCLAGSRVYAQESIYDKVVQSIANAAHGLQQTIGDPFAPKTMHGPQVSRAQYEKILEYIDTGKQEGAKLVAGGAKHGSEGFFIQPTVFQDVRSDMSIIKDEIFGPVVAIVKFKTEEEAIELANDTEYGLACGVFTENLSRATRVSNQLEAGIAWVNCYLTTSQNLPFGGYKQSGYGRESGEEGVNAYTQLKSVYVNIGEKLP